MRLFILLFILAVTEVFPQISDSERRRIIAQLDSTRDQQDLAALSDIVKYNIVEAVPLIEDKILKRYNGDWDLYLDALLHFRSPNLQRILHTMIDSSQIYGTRRFNSDGLLIPPTWDPVRIRVMATYYLFKLGDYSTARHVFEAVRQPESTFAFGYGLILLKEVARNVPDYSDSAKTELIRIARTASLAGERSRAQDDLFEAFGVAAIPELIHLAKNDPDGSIRLTSIKYLFRLNHSDLRPFLIERLKTEPFSLYRMEIAESLVVRYGTVADYKIVQEYVSSETDATIKLLLGRALKEFKPPVPSRTIPVSVLLDTLISAKHQVFALGWLGDKNFVNELDNHLENAQKHLAKGDSANCGKEVEKFQEKVNREYERTVENEKKNKAYDKRFVTVDGWKFLYHNAQYILDRLPRQGGKK